MIDILVFLVILAIIAYVAFYIITTFLPQPVKTPALAIVGLILLLVLLGQMSGMGGLHWPK